MLLRLCSNLVRALLSAAVTLAALSSTPAWADAATAVLSVVPTRTDLAVGDTTTVYVRVSDVVDFYGVDVSLTFDPTLIEVVDADSGATGVQVQAWPSLSTDVLQHTFTPSHEASNAAGTVTLVTTFMAPVAPVSGSIDILAMTIRALAPGNATIAVATSLLSTMDGEAIVHTVAGGSVVVTGPLAHFTFTLPTSVTAGAAFPATITALDSYGAVVASYSGDVTLGGTAGIASAYTTMSLVDGVWAGTLVAMTAGTAQTITATAGDVFSTSGTFAVQPGAAAALSLVASSLVLEVGGQATLTATVADAYGNAVADGTNVGFDCSSGTIGAGATTGVTITSGGVATVTFTAGPAGTAVVTATSGTGSDSVAIVVSAAAAESHRVLVPLVAARRR